MTHHWGYVGALVSAVLFGVSSTLNKIALETVNPLIVAGLIYFVGGVLLFTIHLSPLHKKILSLFETPTETETKISKKDCGVLAFVILCGSIIAPFMLLQGLNETTAINTALLLNTESLFTVLIAFAFLQERGSKDRFNSGNHSGSQVSKKMGLLNKICSNHFTERLKGTERLRRLC